MSKIISIAALVLAKNIRQWVLLAVLGFSTVLSAQGVLSGARTGTIEEINQTDYYLTISGRNYDYDHSITQVFYAGNEERLHFLNEGLVVRFVVNRDGVLTRIEVLGPVGLIQALEES